MVNWRGYICPKYMCILLYVNLFGVAVFHRSMVNRRRGPWYMCILLYVKLLWCSSIPYIYGQLEGGTSALRGAFVYMHSAIYETSVV